MTHPGRRGATALADWLVRHPYILPVAILIAGGLFRFYNLNWDNGHQLHPDERQIYMVISGAAGNPPLRWPTSVSQFFSVTPVTGSPLDPHFFAYGSLPFYLLALIGGLVSMLGNHVPGLSGWASITTYGELPMLGRPVSCMLDLGTVLLVFLIGRRVFGYWTAVTGMALTAFTVLDIQLSHFYTVDTVLAPLVLLTLLGCLSMLSAGSRRPYVLAGIAFGAAMATKTTALLLMIPLVAAPILAAWTSRPWPPEGTLRQRLAAHYRSIADTLNGNLQWALVAVFVGAGTFVVCEPYAVLDRAELLRELSQQTVFLVTNNPPFEVPYTIQYAHTMPYVYQIANMLFWTLGLPLAIPAFLGLFYVAGRSVWGTIRPECALLVLWVVPYFLFVGRFFAKFNRYTLPITPILALFGAALLVALLRRARGRWRLLATAALTASVGLSFAYSVAYMNIYAHPNTRIAASRWIFNHIPPGTPIAVESPWDDTLPLDEGGHVGTEYPETALDLYAGEIQQVDDQKKIANITDVLRHTQYIVMSSERLIGSIPKLPYQYPLAIRYYRLLFANQLNFRLVKVFQQHPAIGPIVVHDYPADESFHVYDHPIVRIWKRTGSISASRVRHLLTTGLPTVPGNVDPTTVAYVLRSRVLPAPDTRLMLTPEQWAADQSAPTMDQMFPPSGFAMQHPTAVWLILLELLGLLAFPFTFLVFRNLGDRGWVISKTLGLLLTGYLVWIAVSVGWVQYDRGPILAALACLLLASLALAWKTRDDMMATVRTSWRSMLVAEIVFLAGFALFVVLRMWYPDLGDQNGPVSAISVGVGRMGEKQMELAYLNAIVRSRVFPPFDPFFAHGYINYYYYGFFLVGTLCKLSQIVPSTGFNLAIATFFALLVGTCFSVGLGLTKRMTPGVLAALFVGVFGNLNGAWQVVRGLWTIATIQSSVPVVGGVLDTLSGLQQAVLAHQPLPAFDYWEARSIVPGDINEFPYFTYLFADLHPHLMAYPMAAAVIALAVNLLRGGYCRLAGRAVAAICAAVLIGAIAVTNPWDFPTYLVVVGVGALLASLGLRRRWTLGLLLRPAGWMAALGGFAVILYLPFERHYQTVFSTGIGLTRSITSDLLISGGVCQNQPASACPGIVHDFLITPLRIYLEHFGFFLFATGSLVALLVLREIGGTAALRRVGVRVQFVLYYRDRFRDALHAMRVVNRMRASRRPDTAVSTWLWTVGFITLALALFQYFLLAFLAALLGLTAFVVVRRVSELDPAELFLLALVGLGAAIGVATQLVFFKDWLAQGPGFRMNTIFKFWDQIWLLTGIASACAVYFVMNRAVAPATSGAAAVRRTGLRTGPGTLPVVSALRWRLPQRTPSGLAALAFSAGAGSADASPLEATAHTRHRPHSTGDAAPWSRVAELFGGHRIWTSCLVVLAACALIYTYAGTISRETVRAAWLPENSVPATLDGMAFMKVAYPGDYAAITWLNAHVRGTPIIAEAPDGYYDWRSRISMFTGLPSVINGIHEPEQRYGDEIDPSTLCDTVQNTAQCQNVLHPRDVDINTLYDSADIPTAWHIVHEYGIRYIIVGSSEQVCDQTAHQCYSRSGLAKFPRMVGHGLRLAFRSHNTSIYQVTGA